MAAPPAVAPAAAPPAAAAAPPAAAAAAATTTTAAAAAPAAAPAAAATTTGRWADDDDEVTADMSKLKGPSTTNDDEDAPQASQLDREVEENSKLLVQQTDPTSPLYSAHTFQELALSEQLLAGIYDMKFVKPSKIQEAALPIILGAKDQKPQNLIAQAQSGTGKTGAFTLGMLSKVDAKLPFPQAICLSPTRELARQTYEVVCALGRFTEVRPLLVVPDNPDLPKGDAKVTAPILVGTPGKMDELVKRKKFNPKNVRMFVLDEADEMIDMQGMGDTSLRLKMACAADCQILLFSATYSDRVKEYAETKFVPKPHVTILLQREKLTVDAIKQLYLDTGSQEKKFDALEKIYDHISVGQSIVFVHTVKTAQELARRMIAAGHKVSLLHGKDMKSEERDRVIDDFRRAKSKVLITTNVLSRGIDVLSVSLVINYDLPLDKDSQPACETYLHRIGRTGRFGNEGVAINFVHDAVSRRHLDTIQKHFDKPIIQFFDKDIETLDEMLRNLKIGKTPGAA